MELLAYFSIPDSAQNTFYLLREINHCWDWQGLNSLFHGFFKRWLVLATTLLFPYYEVRRILPRREGCPRLEKVENQWFSGKSAAYKDKKPSFPENPVALSVRSPIAVSLPAQSTFGSKVAKLVTSTASFLVLCLKLRYLQKLEF